jgi:hypothetical protein
MANTIKIKNSQTTTNTPGSLVQGELAINEQDELLFYRDGAGAVQSFDLSGGGGSGGIAGWTDPTITVTTSGTAITIASSIPAGTEEIEILFEDVSTSGTSVPIIRIGDSGGVESTGYDMAVRGGIDGNTVTSEGNTDGFGLVDAAAAGGANELSGECRLTLWDSANNLWEMDGTIYRLTGSNGGYDFTGRKSLSDTITQIQITTKGGTDTFDNGQVRVRYRQLGGTFTPTVDNFTDPTDFTAGTTTQLTLSVTPDSEDDVTITFDGVSQHHNTWSLSGAVVTFDAVIPLGTSNVEAITYGTLSSGAGTRKLISTATASASSSVDFTGIDATYDRYEFEWDGLTFSGVGRLYFRTSTDGGSTYDSGASDYAYTTTGKHSNGGNVLLSSAGSDVIYLGNNGQTGGNSVESCSGKLALYVPSDAATKTMMAGDIVYWRESITQFYGLSMGGIRNSAADVDAVRFFPAVGTMSGEFRMYGVKKS